MGPGGGEVEARCRLLRLLLGDVEARPVARHLRLLEAGGKFGDLAAHVQYGVMQPAARVVGDALLVVVKADAELALLADVLLLLLDRFVGLAI